MRPLSSDGRAVTNDLHEGCNTWSLQVVELLCEFIETKSISDEEKILLT